MEELVFAGMCMLGRCGDKSSLNMMISDCRRATHRTGIHQAEEAEAGEITPAKIDSVQPGAKVAHSVPAKAGGGHSASPSQAGDLF